MSEDSHSLLPLTMDQVMSVIGVGGREERAEGLDFHLVAASIITLTLILDGGKDLLWLQKGSV